jgi:ribosomal protein S18 acetylase RimI-like enzyme
VIELRALATDDLPALLALQHATSTPAWSAATLEGQLLDPAREHGRNVVVATRDGAIVGVAGWVDAEGEQFGAPVLAADREAADALVDRLVAHARDRGATRLRISCTTPEQAKRDALESAGFRVVLDFITLAIAAERRNPRIELARVAVDSVEPEVVKLLHDETFDGVDNAPPISIEQARHVQQHAWPEASGVWLDGDEPGAFVVAMRDGDALEIDEIGVRASWRRRGLARALVDLVIDIAATAGFAEVRALIASTNAASLALHEAAGLRERYRRAMYQLDLR